MPMNRTDHAGAKTPQRIEALLARHAELERRIHSALQSPGLSEDLIRELKMRKLRLKDEIHEVRSGTSG